jgi:hypothetical protein
MTVGAVEAFCSLRRCTALSPVSSSFDWHHFVDRSALFINSFVVTATSRWKKQNIESHLLFVFSEEHVDGSLEEFCFLVAVCVQQ